MADEPEATEETKPDAAEADSKPDAKPEGDTPEAKVGGDTPEAKGETPEGEQEPDEKPDESDAAGAKSTFETLTANLTDPDEIEAVRDMLFDKLPEDRRQPKAEDTTEADALAAQQRRGEQKRQNEGRRETALSKINAHLKEKRDHFLSDDSKPTDDYDNPLLTQAINELVDAEIALADNTARDTWGDALQTRLTKHGGAIAPDRFKQMLTDVAQDKVPDGMIGAFLDELGQRRYDQGLAEGKAEAKSKDDTWRKAEGVAVRAEIMRGTETEPDAGVSRSTSTPDPKTVEEYMALSQEDRERVGVGGNNR